MKIKLDKMKLLSKTINRFNKVAVNVNGTIFELPPFLDFTQNLPQELLY